MKSWIRSLMKQTPLWISFFINKVGDSTPPEFEKTWLQLSTPDCISAGEHKLMICIADCRDQRADGPIV